MSDARMPADDDRYRTIRRSRTVRMGEAITLEFPRRNALNIRLSALALVAGLLSVSAPLAAHHSWPVSYTKLVTVKGTVTSVSWVNPHPMFSLDVQAADGTIEKWSVGGPAVTQMERNGWSATTLKVGDTITGIGYQFGDGQKIIRLERVVLADGKEMRVYGR